MTTNRLFDAVDAKHRNAQQQRVAAPVPIDSDRTTRYAMRALEAECEQLAQTPVGQRDHAINQAAYNMGTLIGAGVLDEDAAIAALWDAARTTGQPDLDIARALRRGADRNANTGGLETGKLNPRMIADNGTFAAPPPVTIIETPTADRAAQIRERFPRLDWHELWQRDHREEWIVEPILPARRLIALYSAPKVGKSLLMLEIAIAVAQGKPVLGTQPDQPRRVLYVDFENDPEADIRERCINMGTGPDDLDNLVYLSFPSMSYLDSETGSQELLEAVLAYECQVVVIDTISRAVAGEEKENDTWLAFYRHTGIKLKQAQISLIRLDHSGKDESKGQRGGSAKSGDVDAVWRLSKLTDTSFRLECEANRFPITEKTLVLHRRESPLRHVVDAEGRAATWRIKIEAYLAALDDAGAPREVSNKVAGDILRAAGLKVSNDPLAEALRRRKMSVSSFRLEVGTQDEITAIDTSPGRFRDDER